MPTLTEMIDECRQTVEYQGVHHGEKYCGLHLPGLNRGDYECPFVGTKKVYFREKGELKEYRICYHERTKINGVKHE